MNDSCCHQFFHWHLEISSKCRIKCPRCLRQGFPSYLNETELSFDFIQKFFTREFLRSQVLRITLSGGLGDAIYHSQFLEIVRYLKAQNPLLQLVLITNGSHRSERFWKQLAKLLNENDEVIFCIDGWDNASNNLYRLGSDWSSLIAGVAIMVSSLAAVRWHTIIFSFNQHQLDYIRDLAENFGVDQFYLIKSDLFGSKMPCFNHPSLGYDPLEPSSDLISKYSRTERSRVRFHPDSVKIKNLMAFQKRYDAVALKHEEYVRNAFRDYHILPTCRFGYRGSYIDSMGIYYPCSWVSHPFDQMVSEVNTSKILDYRDSVWLKIKNDFNLHYHSFDEILQHPFWKVLEESWRFPDTMAIVCERKCLACSASPNLLATQSLRCK